MRFGLRWFASSCRRWQQFASRHWQWAWWRERRTARPKDGGLSRRSLVFAGKGGVDFSPRSVGRGAEVSVNLKWGARTMAVMMRGKGTSEVVSAPRGLEEGLRREERRWGRRWWVVGSDWNAAIWTASWLGRRRRFCGLFELVCWRCEGIGWYGQKLAAGKWERARKRKGK